MTLQAWFSTLRVRTLPAAASPVIVGMALAHHLGGFDFLPALAALVGALLLQVGTNLANDYYDHVKGADTPERAGPTRASASGALAPTLVRNAAYGTFGLAALVGLYLVFHAGWPIFVIGLAGILSGILYTAGPKPLAYVGLGDVFVFVFFGPVAVAGTVFVQTGTWEWAAVGWGIALGAIATAILVVNNLRDRPTDTKAGKRTLAVRFGDRFSQLQYTALLALAFVAPFVLGHFADDLWQLLPILSAVTAIPVMKRIWGPLETRQALNPALGGTARVLLLFSLLTALGLLL